MTDKQAAVQIAAQMSSQEIVFWVSLFGLDLGLTQMLPERLRAQIGVVVTALSATGLLWSLGYPVVASVSGWKMAILFIAVGAVISFLIELIKLPGVPLEFNDAADDIEQYATRIRAKYRSESLRFDQDMGRVVRDRYWKRYGLDAMLLAKQANRRKLATALRTAKSVGDLVACSQLLNKAANEMRDKRQWLMLIPPLLGGGLIGAFLFGVMFWLCEFYADERCSRHHLLARLGLL